MPMTRRRSFAPLAAPAAGWPKYRLEQAGVGTPIQDWTNSGVTQRTGAAGGAALSFYVDVAVDPATSYSITWDGGDNNLAMDDFSVGGDTAGTTTLLARIPGTVQPQTGDAYAIVSDAAFGNARLVRATTPANTLDVSATGEAGLDFNNLKGASAATTLANITVPAVTTAGSVTGNIGGNVAGSVGSVAAAVQLDLTQAVPDARTATVGGALAGAWAVGWGKVVKDVVAKALQVWGPGNGTATPTATFTLDDGTSPTTRTPQ
jgi:hypothetical protein